MAISLVGQAGIAWPGSGSSTQTVNYHSGPGSVLILAFGFDQPGPASGLTITDTASNTWHYSTSAAGSPPWCEVQVGGGNFYGSFIAWTLNAASVNSVTMTQTGGQHWQGVLSEWGGIGAEETGAEAADGSTTSAVTSPSVSPANAGDLVVAHADNNGGWSTTTATQFSADRPASCYSLPGATGPFTITWGNSGTGGAVAVAVFSPVSGASHTATATLTATPSFAAARLRGHARTAALAVTPSFAAARTAAHTRHPALAVTPSAAAAATRRAATPAAVFAAGTPHFQWETQEPYLS